MYKILTLNKIAEIGTNRFDKAKYEVGDNVENPNAVLVRSASMHESELNSDLVAIARAGAGTNNIPIDRCSEEGVVVFNTPGANANAVKELVLLGALISSRKVPQAIDWAKTLKGKGDEVGKLVEKGKSQFAGPELAGKKLGVIGLGAIGAAVANAASHLGMEVHGVDPYLSVEGALHLEKDVIYLNSYKEIFETCDYITLHVPLNDSTREMVNAESIASMKENVRILNFSRGELVSSSAILEGINSGKVAAYVTDFPTDDLLDVEGVIALPHLGASTPESEDNCAVMAVKELIDYIENGNIKNSVNLPNVSVVKTGDAKICVIHKNVEGLITNIAGVVSHSKLNIENMESKSKKNYAYTVLDVKGVVSDSLIEKLTSVENVIKVRVV